VVLHHFPKKRDGHAEQILVDAVVSAGYPVPEWVRLLPVSALAGAGSVAEMPPFTQGGEGLSRYQVHAVIRFSEKVAGPVLIGRGRFRGYGLFAPFEGEGK
jgi:CRISPR-associated protein Csb2